MFSPNISDVHRSVIESLQQKIETPQKATKFSGTIISRIVKSYDDQSLILKTYNCLCGSSMEVTKQVFYNRPSSVVNEHTLTCTSCSTSDKVRFTMLRSALESAKST